MQYEEFADCIAWWNNRTEKERAWKVPAADLLVRDQVGGVVSGNLDVSNPNRAADLAHRSPEELIESILEKERQIAEIMENIRAMVKKRP